MQQGRNWIKSSAKKAKKQEQNRNATKIFITRVNLSKITRDSVDISTVTSVQL